MSNNDELKKKLNELFDIMINAKAKAVNTIYDMIDKDQDLKNILHSLEENSNAEIKDIFFEKSDQIHNSYVRELGTYFHKRISIIINSLPKNQMAIHFVEFVEYEFAKYIEKKISLLAHSMAITLATNVIRELPLFKNNYSKERMDEFVNEHVRKGHVYCSEIDLVSNRNLTMYTKDLNETKEQTH